MSIARSHVQPTARTRAGSARISIVWMIAMIVLALISMVLAYFANEEKTAAEAEASAARKAAQEADERTIADGQAVVDISRALGFYDETAARPRSNDKAVVTALAELKATFGLGQEVKNLADALPLVQRAYNESQRAAQDAKAAEELALKEKSASESAKDEVIGQKDSMVANLTKEKADELATAAARQTELEQRVASITQTRDQFSAESQKLKSDLDQALRSFEDERSAFAARMKNMAESLKFLEQPEAKDASILTVSSNLPYGWIDIGANQRLAVGTRFHVVSGRAGSKVTKAWAEVTRTEADKSEVTFFDLTDRFDPPVPGDFLFNPAYDPVGERHAVLAGRFSGLYSEAELKVLLERLNIKVQNKLDVNTDYLIVGSELYVDEEGNAVEAPIQVADLAVYKNAEAQGVLILPVKDLYAYFKY